MTYVNSALQAIDAAPGQLRACVKASEDNRALARQILIEFEGAMQRIRGGIPGPADDAKQTMQPEPTVISALTETQNDTYYALEGIHILVAELHRLVD